MTRRDEDTGMQELLIEQPQLQRTDQLPSKHPMVLSCGGIYIPRPKPMGPNDEIYKILNIANQKEPTKIVMGPIHLNLLQEVLHKESMN